MKIGNSFAIQSLKKKIPILTENYDSRVLNNFTNNKIKYKMHSQHNHISILYSLVCYCAQLLKVYLYTRTSKIICFGLTVYDEIAKVYM